MLSGHPCPGKPSNVPPAVLCMGEVIINGSSGIHLKTKTVTLFLIIRMLTMKVVILLGVLTRE